MLEGLIDLPWWGYVLVTLLFTHVTIVSVTVYLHRHQAHRTIDMHPLAAHFFRAWLWLTTGMNTGEWTAVHRKHHANVESGDDPHSPQVHGIRAVLLHGAELYQVEAQRPETLEQFAFGTPDDWLERNVYSRHSCGGIISMFIINVALFGPLGLTVWAVQMMWIPVFAAGIINGVGHWGGYRNFETPDASTNICPWGILIGGEELHNNHHAFANSARFSSRPWEFDAGWTYIRLLKCLGLASVRNVAPDKPLVDVEKLHADFETLKAVVGSRMHVMADYAGSVINRVHREELNEAAVEIRALLKQARALMIRSEERLDEHDRGRLSDALAHSRSLEVVYAFRLRLQQIFEQRTTSRERLLVQLQLWCREAQASGIQALEEFGERLQCYTVQPA